MISKWIYELMVKSRNNTADDSPNEEDNLEERTKDNPDRAFPGHEEFAYLIKPKDNKDNYKK